MKKYSILLSSIFLFFAFFAPAFASDSLDVDNSCEMGFCAGSMQSGYWSGESWNTGAISQAFYSSTSTISGFDVRISSTVEDSCSYSVLNGDDTLFVSGNFGTNGTFDQLIEIRFGTHSILDAFATNRISITCYHWETFVQSSATDLYLQACTKPADGGDVPCNSDIFLRTYYPAPVVPPAPPDSVWTTAFLHFIVINDVFTQAVGGILLLSVGLLLLHLLRRILKRYLR